MKNLIVLFVIVGTLSFLSCGPDFSFEQTFEIENADWTYDDTLDFIVNIKDTAAIYNLYLDIEHATNYSRQNLYVMIYTRFPSGERIRERVSLELANPAGQWYGDCNKDWCTLRVNIQDGAYFSALGKHVITLEQYMRMDSLPGIKSLSIKIEDTGQRRNSQEGSGK